MSTMTCGPNVLTLAFPQCDDGGVTLRYAAVKRFHDDRLVSEHLYFDQLEFLQQLGALS